MDKSDAIGINKSLRMKILVDVEKPLMSKVEIKTGRGSIEVPVKYEKLPVFCYVCGMLGHGEKDCDDVFVARKFSERLRVSTPWKASKIDEKIEENQLGKAAKKLFVTKTQSLPRKEAEDIGEVVEKLQVVSLDNKGSLVPGEKEVEVASTDLWSGDWRMRVQRAMQR
uniref:CCHC-type domain-containing protein n=1 Tax=Chenopodium quinoa TaxID=63459 RepID=A0A803L9B5_CHEQI